MIALQLQLHLLALSRVIARRGHVKIVTSENGNNFIGGESEICDALRDLIPFVQFKKPEKHPCRIVNFSKVAG